MPPDGPEDREWEACERHDAACEQADIDAQLADESLSEVLLDIARTRINHFVRNDL